MSTPEQVLQDALDVLIKNLEKAMTQPTIDPIVEQDLALEDAPSAARHAAPPTCNLPGCTEDPVTRGLCDAHWCTHRGLADPEPVADVAPEVALP